MASTERFHPRDRHPVEMTTDPGFTARIRRLIGVSIVALGSITLLVFVVADAGWLPTALLISAWVLMPALLAYSLSKPVWRYLLALPAVAASVALLLVAIESTGPSWAWAGWWMMTIGVLSGGSLGTWFWYRWLPVPRPLDEPFSRGRWVLVSIHAGLIATGWLLVFFAELG